MKSLSIFCSDVWFCFFPWRINLCVVQFICLPRPCFLSLPQVTFLFNTFISYTSVCCFVFTVSFLVGQVPLFILSLVYIFLHFFSVLFVFYLWPSNLGVLTKLESIRLPWTAIYLRWIHKRILLLVLNTSVCSVLAVICNL